MVVVVTYLLIARTALRTATASESEGDSDALADTEVDHAGALCNNGPGHLVAGNVGKSNTVIVAPPRMPIAATDSIGPNAEHDTTLWRYRIWRIDDVDFAPERREECRLHNSRPPVSIISTRYQACCMSHGEKPFTKQPFNAVESPHPQVGVRVTDVDSYIDTTEDADVVKERLLELEGELSKFRADAEKDISLKPFQIELLKLQRYLEANAIPMIVLFEGRDASGKGGTIRRIARYMNEKRYQVVALGKPTKQQKTQWYFQRYVERFPAGGEMVLFDRSWYNRALVEPVFGFCTKKEYRNFIRGVTGFEKDLVRQGTVLVKLYFSVDKAIQEKRFARRKNDALRQWKLSEIDVQAQEYWDDFTEMKHRMLERTSTGSAEWTIIRSNDKPRARLNAMKVILNSVDYDDRNPDLDFSVDPEIVFTGREELDRMDDERDRLGRPRL